MKWTKEQEQLLLDNYPHLDKEQLLKMFPGRTMIALSHKYSRISTTNSNHRNRIKNEKDLFAKLADTKFSNSRPIYSHGFYNMNTKCWWICPKCNNRFKRNPNIVINQQRVVCKKCRGCRCTSETAMLSRLKDIQSFGFRPRYNNGYCGINKKCWWICPNCNIKFKRRPSRIIHGKELVVCTKCSTLLRGSRYASEAAMLARLSNTKYPNLRPIYSCGYCGIGKKCWWVCPNCDKKFERTPSNVIDGKQAVCIECSMQFRGKNRRKTIDDAKDILRPLNLGIDEDSYISFAVKSTIICSCGRRFQTTITHIKNGNTSSCGFCQAPSIGERYGKLTVIDVQITHKLKVVTRCDCGNEYAPSKFSEINDPNGTKSCGHCNDPKIGEKFGMLTIVDVIPSLSHGCKVKAQCECGKIVGPFKMTRVRRKGSCGNCKLYCNGKATSYKAKDLQEMIEEVVGHSCEHNYDIYGKNFDIVDLENKIAIEYDEHHWHRVKNDTTKKERADTRLAIKHGFKMLRIRAGNDLPTKEQLKKAINNHFEHGAKQHTITTPGWKNASIK